MGLSGSGRSLPRLRPRPWAEPPVRPQPPGALYVHVPFCLSVCPYCDFVVYAGSRARGPVNEIAAFVDAVLNEIELRADIAGQAFPSRPPLRSLYFGGGTPSLLTRDAVQRILTVVADRFGLEADAEVTLEANPGRADRGDLRGFRAAGVTRLSIGAQSLVAAELVTLGRRHDPAAVVETVREARDAGFDDVSIDLLYDVPGQTLETWATTLDRAIELGLDHVSVYALTLTGMGGEGTAESDDRLRPTSGALRWRARSRLRQDDDRAADCYALAEARLSAAGLHWYEISNWARPGHESRHNLAYWTGAAYEAVGPGAHAYDGALTRRWNGARLDAYLAALLSADGQPRLPPGGSATADRRDAEADRLILALRLARGVPLERAKSRTHAAAFRWARDRRLVESTAGVARLTLAGRLLSNEVFTRLV